MEGSIRPQFEAFHQGFHTLSDGAQSFKLFHNDELQLLICGEQDLDFATLKSVTLYDGGYEADTDVIQWFWEVVGGFTDEEKKKLLSFSTGTDRVPVGGLKNLRFIVAKQGADSDRLPTSHTCFNVLLLPHYSDKAKLDRLLRQAILHAEGFGML